MSELHCKKKIIKKILLALFSFFLEIITIDEGYMLVCLVLFYQLFEEKYGIAFVRGSMVGVGVNFVDVSKCALRYYASIECLVSM